ncbi:sulfur carrier protein ThiS [Coralliovum pocilloporae]|uniref:sulfur carrier protein ThiS n=1 Tax=Coralliovum pocilloporae TaxID=3066369 RepID=UPI003306DFFB
MKITLNGKAHNSAADTLSALLDECGYGDRPVATALNEEFVPAPDRAAQKLQDGDRVEVVAPMQGG